MIEEVEHRHKKFSNSINHLERQLGDLNLQLRDKLHKEGENLKAIQDFLSSSAAASSGTNNLVHFLQADHIDPPPDPILQIGDKQHLVLQGVLLFGWRLNVICKKFFATTVGLLLWIGMAFWRWLFGEIMWSMVTALSDVLKSWFS